MILRGSRIDLASLLNRMSALEYWLLRCRSLLTYGALIRRPPAPEQPDLGDEMSDCQVRGDYENTMKPARVEVRRGCRAGGQARALQGTGVSFERSEVNRRDCDCHFVPKPITPATSTTVPRKPARSLDGALMLGPSARWLGH